MGRPYIMSIDFYDQATSDKNVVALDGSELLNGRIDLDQFLHSKDDAFRVQTETDAPEFFFIQIQHV